MRAARDLNSLSILDIHAALGGTTGKTVAGEVYGTCWGDHQNGTAHDNLRLNEEKGTYACHCLGDSGGGGKFDLVVFAGQASDHKSASKYLIERGLLAPPEASNGAITTRRTTASFEYLTEDGSPFARVDRVEPGRNGKPKDFYPKLWTNGGYAQRSGLQGQQCPLYGLPALRAGIEANALIVFCEGEGNVDTLMGAIRKGNVPVVATTIQGGTPARLTDEHFHQLRGAQGIVVMIDADVPGRKAGKLRAAQIASKTGAEVRIIDLYADRTDGSDLKNWLREGHTIEQLLAIIEQTPTLDLSAAPANMEINRTAPQPIDASDDARPVINAGEGDLCVITAQALDALHIANDDIHLVRYADALCRLERDDNDLLTPVRLSPKHVRDELSRAANWYRVRQVKLPNSEELETVAVASFPPIAVCDNILVQAELPFPVLSAIVDVPTFAPDGTLHTVQGYDAKTKTYYDPAPGMKNIAVPTHPTKDEIARARAVLLEDFLFDFPFASASDKANAVGAILTPFVQQMDLGPIAAACYEAPVPGSGKSLLAELSFGVGVGIGKGSRLKVTGPPPKEEEAKKVITTAVLANFGVLIFDNIEGKFSSPSLAQALTTTIYSDRILGVNQWVTMPWRMIVALTTNNAVLDHDLTRRSYRIRIDPRMERPEDRTGFRHDDLHGWCRENRPSLAQAALTLIMAWVAAGRPPGKVTMGSFDRWAKTISGILNHVGIPGFLQNARQFSETANRDGDEMRSFISAWYAEFGEREVTTKDVLLLAVAGDLPLGDGTDPAKRLRLGKLLSKYRDRVFDIGEDGHELSLCLKSTGATGGRARWKTVRGVQVELFETQPVGIGGKVGEGGISPGTPCEAVINASIDNVDTCMGDGSQKPTSTHLPTYPNRLGFNGHPFTPTGAPVPTVKEEYEAHNPTPPLRTETEGRL